MLEFLYCDSIELEENLAMDLLVVATDYSISGLRSRCEEFLSSHLSIDNLVAVANLSDMVQSVLLKESVIRFLKANVHTFNEREDLFDIPRDIMFSCVFDFAKRAAFGTKI